MGEVNITINGRAFKLGCDDGEEPHLAVLAEHLGKHVENLRHTIGKTGDEKLYLMAGLMVCDELWDARDQLLKAEEKIKRLTNVQTKAVEPPPKEPATPAVTARPAAAPAQPARPAAPPQKLDAETSQAAPDASVPERS